MNVVDVFILTARWDYGYGDKVLGVFSTKEKARAFLATTTLDKRDRVTLTTETVDEPMASADVEIQTVWER